MLYPLAAFLIFVLTGTARDISVRSTNEIIVYNTPGRSTIGIRTGKILNLYSDTTIAGAEVKRHCSTLGLKLIMNKTLSGCNCIEAGQTRILITGYRNRGIFERFSPDIVILSGAKPEMEFENDSGFFSDAIVIAAFGIPAGSLGHLKKSSKSFPVYLVRKSGAFIRRI